MAGYVLDLTALLSAAVVLLALALATAVGHYRRRLEEARQELEGLQHRKRSLSTTYGRITEQFAPFMDAYPHDPKDFRFLGSPVDGVQFTDEGVVFVEIKSNSSRLSAAQRRIKRHVEEGRVAWLEFRVEEGGNGAAAASEAPEYEH